MTAVGMNDVPVVLATVATEFGSWLAEGKLVPTDTALHTQNDKYSTSLTSVQQATNKNPLITQ